MAGCHIFRLTSSYELRLRMVVRRLANAAVVACVSYKIKCYLCAPVCPGCYVMSDTYYTIQEQGEGQLREKLSRFISYALHVDNEEEARTFVSSLKARYHDARHVCWAFATRDGRRLSQDDGEPSGTAGRPILGQIDAMGLTDVVVGVVRYFGGIKLGPSGLIAAYREAARLALQSVPAVECHSQHRFAFTFPYLVLNDVMKVVKSEPCTVVEQLFDNSCSMVVDIREDYAERLFGRLDAVSGLTIAD